MDREELQGRDDRLRLALGGSGPFALQHHGQALEFANVFVKEL